uniref:Putative plant transposon protein domain-containing protein n=1 Tax=Cajanus cajan TaxID=3821 RepID=A0A151QS37_CAJCA|nr:hypothetical protein KK1_046125 [Cajanus cajan]
MGKSRPTHEIPASKKRKGAASSNPPPHDSDTEEPTHSPVASIRLDRNRFMTKTKQQRYTELEPRQIVAERRVELEAGEYMDFQRELTRRKWNKLATPEKKYNEEIIKEFYANAYPLQRTDQTRNSWVRGAVVSYSRDAIQQYLGSRDVIGGDGLDEFGRLKKAHAFNADKMAKLLCLPGCTYTVGLTGNPVSFLRKNLTTTARIWQNLLYCNVYCITHISDLNMPRATLLYSILQKTEVDIPTIISDEIHKIVLSSPSSTGVSRPLGFPGLITGLCLFSGSRLPGNLNKALRPPINAAYIKIHCKSEQHGDASQPRPPRHGQGSSSSQVPAQDFMAAHFHHIEQQNLANHLALMSLNTSMYHAHQQQFQGGPPFQWPSPEAFQQHFYWPGDSPHFEGGEEEQPMPEDEQEQEGGAGGEEEEGGDGAEGEQEGDDHDDEDI